jgi:phage-related holin
MPTTGIWNNFIAWISALTLIITAAFKLTVDAAAISCLLVAILVAVDFFTGIIASIIEGNRLTSRKLRWSIVKLTVYATSIMFTTMLGALLHALECSTGNIDGIVTISVILYIVKIEAWAICWIEIVSILENSKRIRPDNIYIQFMLWLVSVEFINKIPKFADFLKQKDSKYDEHETNK